MHLVALAASLHLLLPGGGGSCGEAGHHCFEVGGPACDDVACCNAVCALAGACCETEWDAGCVALALDVCEVPTCVIPCPPGTLLEGDPCGGIANIGCDGPAASGSDCCVAGGGPSCDDADCMNLVCGLDAFCCMVAWDEICAAESVMYCPELCAASGDLVTALPLATDLCGGVWAERGERDIDWYLVVLPELSLVTIAIESRTPLEVSVPDNDGIAECAVITGVDAFATTKPCEPLELGVCLEAGAHWVRVSPVLDDGLPCDTMDTRYMLRVDAIAATCRLPDPPNETCATATPIGEGSWDVSTAGATTELPAADDACVDTAGGEFRRDIWFRFDAPRSGTVRVQTCGTCTYAARLAAYSGTCGELTLVECDTDGGACPFKDPRVHFATRAGETHFLRLGSRLNETGEATLTVSYLPCEQPYEVEVIPLLPGHVASEGRGVSSDGEVVGDSDNTVVTNLYHVFRWSPEAGVEEITGLPQQFEFDAVTVNAGGVAIANRPNGPQAVFAPDLTLLSYLAPAGCGVTADRVNDINDSDSAVGTLLSGPCSPRAVRWLPFEPAELLAIPAGAEVATGISGSGAICGNGTPTPGGPTAGWLLANGSFQWISAPNGPFDLEVVDVTDDLRVAGHYRTGPEPNAPTVVFLWQEGRFSTLTPPPGYQSMRATHVSDDGTVVGAAGAGVGSEQSFLWREGGSVRFLDDIVDRIPGAFTYRGHVRINDAAQLATTMRIDGARRAVRLTPRLPIADIDCDGTVGGTDLAILLGTWGPCAANSACASDIDVNGVVDAADLALVLGAWGTR